MGWCSLVILATSVACVLGHGRLLGPPGRSSAWRSGFSTPVNYNDDALYCGGFYHQYSINDGKCGICGDAYDQPIPRDHELGGKYGTGVIVAKYKAGDVFTATIELTAFHQGFWELKICPDPERTDQECFDQYVVELADGSGTKFYPTGSEIYEVEYRLPSDLVCDHCVVQWRYSAANNWGICEDGSGALGCGNQEQFRACSDIMISESTLVKEDEDVDEKDSVEDNDFDLGPEDIDEVPYPCISYVKKAIHNYRRRN